jgi:hypothetical protein
MAEKMTGSDIVLVVCSEAWQRRYQLREEPGVGAGVTFEGGMLSRRIPNGIEVAFVGTRAW